MKKFILVSALLAQCLSAFGLYAEQDDDPEHLPYWESDHDIESAREAGEISSELSDELQALYDNPLDINRAGAEELAALPGLNLSEAREIVAERERNGDYDSSKDLIERKILPLETYQKIRMFVTAVPGAFWLKTRGELREEFFTSPYDPSQTNESVSSLSMRTRVKGSDSKNRYRAGGTFLTDHRTLAQGFTAQNQLKIVSVRDSRWVKTYAGYDPPRGSLGFLRQFYAGNFRAGFFEGVEREMPSKFFPDERLNEPGSIEIHPERRRAAPLKGAGGQFSVASGNVSLLYSRNNYPTVVPLSAQSGPGVSSAAVDDALDLEIMGAHADYPVGEGSTLEAFWQKQSAERRIVPLAKPILNNQVWGAALKNTFDDWGSRFVFSRMDQPLEGRIDQNFYFARIGYRSALGPSWTVTYKNLGRGYYNPSGSFFTGNYLWQFSSRLIQELGESFRLRLDYSESEKMIGDLVFVRQEGGAQLRWYSSPELTLQWGERYRTPGPVSVSKSFSDDGTLKSIHVDSPDELRSSLRLTHRALKKVETRFGYDLLTSKKETSPLIQVGQYLTAGLNYKALEELEFRAWLDFSDPALSSSNNETQSWSLELRSLPLKNIDLRFRWKNLYRLRAESIEGSSDLEENRGTSENSFSLRVVAKW